MLILNGKCPNKAMYARLARLMVNVEAGEAVYDPATGDENPTPVPGFLAFEVPADRKGEPPSDAAYYPSVGVIFYCPVHFPGGIVGGTVRAARALNREKHLKTHRPVYSSRFAEICTRDPHTHAGTSSVTRRAVQPARLVTDAIPTPHAIPYYSTSALFTWYVAPVSRMPDLRKITEMPEFNAAVASIFVNTVGLPDAPLQRFELPAALFNFGGLPKALAAVRHGLHMLTMAHITVVHNNNIYFVGNGSSEVAWSRRFTPQRFEKPRGQVCENAVAVPPGTTPLLCGACSGPLPPTGCYAAGDRDAAPTYLCFPCYACAPKQKHATASHCVYADPDQHLADLAKLDGGRWETAAMLLGAKVTAANDSSSVLVEPRRGPRFFVRNTFGLTQAVSPHYVRPEFKQHPYPVMDTMGSVYHF